MPKLIALIRGINVGGLNKVAMSDLREMFTELGFAAATTLLQSGNVVFESDRRAGAELERLLEKAAPKRLAVAADYLIRSADEWVEIVAGNPFAKEAKADPSHLVVMCLKSAPKAKDVNDLQASIQGPEVVRCAGRQLYIVYPAGIGRSKLTGSSIEARLGVQGTARNWNTVHKLLAACR